MNYPQNTQAFDPAAQLANEIAGASITNRGLYLEPGYYEVRIERSFFLATQSGNQFIVEATMVRASPTDPNLSTKFLPGVKVSWTCNLTKHQSAKGNVKGFIAAMLGIPAGDKHRVDSEITPAVITNATAPGANPFGGLLATVQVQHTPTKPKPVQTPQGMVMQSGVYSLHSWATSGQRDPAWRPEGAPQGQAAPMQAPPALPASMPMQAAPSGQFGAAPGWGAPPPPPMAPPALPAPFPPQGWQAHPQAPGWFFHEVTRDVRSEADLRNG